MKEIDMIEATMYCLDNYKVSVWDDIGDGIKCQIGDYWFYLPLPDGVDLVESATDEIAMTIVSAITHPEQNGLGDAEAAYYVATIKECWKKMKEKKG